MTTTQTRALLTDLEAAFPYPPLTPERAALFARKLAAEDYEPARIAIDHLIEHQESDRFPSVAAILSAIRAVAHQSGAAAVSADRPLMMFRIYDADLDDYRELDQPVPWTPALQAESNAAIEEAWRRENTAVTA